MPLYRPAGWPSAFAAFAVFAASIAVTAETTGWLKQKQT